MPRRQGIAITFFSTNTVVNLADFRIGQRTLTHAHVQIIAGYGRGEIRRILAHQTRAAGTLRNNNAIILNLPSGTQTQNAQSLECRISYHIPMQPGHVPLE